VKLFFAQGNASTTTKGTPKRPYGDYKIAISLACQLYGFLLTSSFHPQIFTAVHVKDHCTVVYFCDMYKAPLFCYSFLYFVTLFGIGMIQLLYQASHFASSGHMHCRSMALKCVPPGHHM
jgi:hypothetical protein